MIASCLTLSLLLLTALAAAMRAASANPPPGIDSKGAIPTSATGAAATTKPVEPASTATAPVAIPATVAPAGATTTPTPTAPTPDVVKPGILTAVKAKGPPPARKGPAAPIPLSPRYQQVRDRIGALFNTRNAPPAPPDPTANPFRAPGAAPIASVPGVEGAPPVAVSDDLTLLQQAIATIRVKGTVTRNKILQLVINTGPGKEGTYKEGDIINVALPTGDPVHVRVRQVAPHSVTLTVNEAEMVLKF